MQADDVPFAVVNQRDESVWADVGARHDHLSACGRDARVEQLWSGK